MANYTGGVLTKSTSSFLFNNAITKEDIGAYKETDGSAVLILKNLGYSLYLGPNSKTFMTCNDPGALRAQLITLNMDCPCDECEYEYGFKVTSKLQMPGHRNSIPKPLMNPYYGKISSVECNLGKIVDSQVLAMEDDLIGQINGYMPINNDGLIPAQWATRYYIVEDTDTSDISTLTISIGGTDYVVSSAIAPDPVFSLVENINANVGIAGRVKAIFLEDPSGASYSIALFADTFEGGANLFTVTAGADVAIIQRSILLVSRDKKFSISVEVDKSIGKVEGLNLARITTPAGGVPAQYDITFQSPTADVTYAKNSPCTADNALVFPVNPLLPYVIAGDWVITMVSAVIYAFSAADDSSIVYEPGAFQLDLATKTGSWEVLSNDFVFQQFSHSPNLGGLSQQVRKNHPIAGMRYCKIDIVWEDEIADLVGANHMNSRRGAVTLYFPMATKCFSQFLAADGMGRTNVARNLSLQAFINAVIAGNVA